MTSRRASVRATKSSVNYTQQLVNVDDLDGFDDSDDDDFKPCPFNKTKEKDKSSNENHKKKKPTKKSESKKTISAVTPVKSDNEVQNTDEAPEVVILDLDGSPQQPKSQSEEDSSYALYSPPISTSSQSEGRPSRSPLLHPMDVVRKSPITKIQLAGQTINSETSSSTTGIANVRKRKYQIESDSEDDENEEEEPSVFAPSISSAPSTVVMKKKTLTSSTKTEESSKIRKIPTTNFEGKKTDVVMSANRSPVRENNSDSDENAETVTGKEKKRKSVEKLKSTPGVDELFSPANRKCSNTPLCSATSDSARRSISSPRLPKWTPPAKVGTPVVSGHRSSGGGVGCSTPNLGLRVGLSRKTNVKPLHPSARPKIE